MLTTEMQMVLTATAARLRNTKYTSLAQMLEMKKMLNSIMDPMIGEHQAKKEIANRKKAKDRAEKEAYRSKFRQEWVRTFMPVGATVKTVSAKAAYIVVALKPDCLVVTDPKRSITTEVMHKNVLKVMDVDGKLLDIYDLAAHCKQPTLKITENPYSQT